jgi:putative ubiquitin-RnfH superfamily antitoxin RatB of RatAB toxin-antitoxin module
MANADLHISVVFSPRAGEVDEVELKMPEGATVADALSASGMQARHPSHDLGKMPVGLWGAFCERGDVLRDRDRVELYRPLLVDPKEARRKRQAAQRGARQKKV